MMLKHSWQLVTLELKMNKCHASIEELCWLVWIVIEIYLWIEVRLKEIVRDGWDKDSHLFWNLFKDIMFRLFLDILLGVHLRRIINIILFWRITSMSIYTSMIRKDIILDSLSSSKPQTENLKLNWLTMHLQNGEHFL